MMMESGCGLQTSQQVNLATGLGHPNPPRKATSFAANNTTVREKSVSFASRDLTAPPAKRRKTLLSKKARDASVSHLSVKDSEDWPQRAVTMKVAMRGVTAPKLKNKDF